MLPVLSPVQSSDFLWLYVSRASRPCLINVLQVSGLKFTSPGGFREEDFQINAFFKLKEFLALSSSSVHSLIPDLCSTFVPNRDVFVRHRSAGMWIYSRGASSQMNHRKIRVSRQQSASPLSRWRSKGRPARLSALNQVPDCDEDKPPR